MTTIHTRPIMFQQTLYRDPRYELNHELNVLETFGFIVLDVNPAEHDYDELEIEHIMRAYQFITAYDGDIELVDPRRTSREILATLDGRQVFGMIPKSAQAISFSVRDNNADDYTVSPVVNTDLRRWSDRVTVCEDGEQPREGTLDAQFVLDRMHSRGMAQAFVKNATRKGATVVIPTAPEERDHAMMKIYKYFSVSAHRPVLLVQEVVVFEDEYRFFVVDGKIVTGSPRVLKLTPKNHNQQIERSFCGPFDDRTETGINRLREDGKLYAEYRVHAQNIVDALHKEQPGWKHYALDLGTIVDRTAFDDDNDNSHARTVATVELNGLSNAGLYGCDLEALVAAQIKHPATLNIVDHLADLKN